MLTGGSQSTLGRGASRRRDGPAEQSWEMASGELPGGGGKESTGEQGKEKEGGRVYVRLKGRRCGMDLSI